MAITAVGFDGTVTEAQWSRLDMRSSEIGYRHGVWSGGEVSPATGRAVSVAVVDAVTAGVWFTSDAAETVTIAANTGASPRVDYVVSETNWTANTVTFKPVAGAVGGNPPALTQTAGTLWQMPYARVTVDPGVTSIAASKIEVCKPLRREVQAYEGNMSGITLTGSGASGQPIGPTHAIVDPGWPYRLDISCSLYAREANADRRTRVEVLSGSTVLARGISSPLSVNQQVVASAKPARTFTGPQRLGLRFYSHDANGIVEVGPSGANTFDVHVIPA